MGHLSLLPGAPGAIPSLKHALPLRRRKKSTRNSLQKHSPRHPQPHRPGPVPKTSGLGLALPRSAP